MKTCNHTVAILFMLIAVTLCSSYAEAKETKPEKIVVTINGETITQAAIDTEIEQKLASAAGRVPPEQLAQIEAKMKEQAVDFFITRTILNQKCAQDNIIADPQEVSKEIDKIKKNLPANITFEDALKANGTSLEAIQKDISLKLKFDKLFKKNIVKLPTPTEKDAKAFYEQNQKSFEVPESVEARHILIKSSKDEDEQVQTAKKLRAKELHKQLVNGADFAEIAAANSDCPSKNKGGSLGTFQRGRMVKEFEDAAFTQKKDEIGPVIETNFGYHIIQVQAHNAATQKSFEESKDQIIKFLEQKNQQKAVQDYIEKLKNKATIVYAGK